MADMTRVRFDWLTTHYTGPEPFDNCDDCQAPLPEYEIRGGLYCEDCARRLRPVSPTPTMNPKEK